MVPLPGIEGTLTQMLADDVFGFQVSIQKGMGVTPSLAVKRTSLPSLLALAKANEPFRTTWTWKLLSAAGTY